MNVLCNHNSVSISAYIIQLGKHPKEFFNLNKTSQFQFAHNVRDPGEHPEQFRRLLPELPHPDIPCFPLPLLQVAILQTFYSDYSGDGCTDYQKLKEIKGETLKCQQRNVFNPRSEPYLKRPLFALI